MSYTCENPVGESVTNIKIGTLFVADIRHQHRYNGDTVTGMILTKLS